MKKIFFSMLVATMTAFTFTSCEDVPAAYEIPGGGNGGNGGSTETVGNGTAENPYTVEDVKKHGATGSNVFVKAYIVGFVPEKAIDDAKFTAEGCEAVSNVIIAASADETSVDNVMPVQLPVGDVRNAINLKDNPTNIKQEVVLCGNIEAYFGKTGLKSVVWAKLGDKEVGAKPGTEGGGTGITGTPKGTGTKDDPFNSVAANTEASKLAANAVSEQGYYIKGKVVSVKEAFSAQYGNASFYISDDGQAGGQFLVFRSLYLGNQKWTEGQENIQVGDEVVVYGKLTNYMGNTPETAQNTTYLVSVNGKTEGGSTGGEDKPGEDKPAGNGNVAIDGTTLTLSNPEAQAGTETIEVLPSDFFKESPADATTITLSDGTKIVFEANGEKNGPKYYSGTNFSNIRVYKNNKITFEGHKAIAKIEISCDIDKSKNVNCVGNATATVNVEGKKMVYTNVFTEASGGGVQLRINKIVITYAK
ncbi:DUF6359 domain-containing protein [Leyella stercorea]|uniref:DUF6359 domain-containing protein n=1 Tax=Leyella stercorea TaxID=363265 RepID=UPI002432291F|nr:DUF6359 domain-containing protein [Leyella stercorea]